MLECDLLCHRLRSSDPSAFGCSMPLYLFLLVVVSLSCGSLPPLETSIWRPAMATAGLTMAWVLLCHIGARMLAKQVVQDGLDPIQGARWLEKQLDIFRWLGLGVIVLCLGGFGLARVLPQVPILASSLFAQAVVLLAPGLAIAAATWSAENVYGMMLGYTQRSFGAHLRSVFSALRNGMAWLIAPVLILLALADLVTLLPVSGQTTGWITAAIMIVVVPLGLPWLVRTLFKTEPLDGETECWVGSLLTESGLGKTKAVRWNTGGRSFNAMVAGFVAPLRTLMVSDRLLDELPRQQVAMVVLHEAAHLQRRHVPLRMVSILPAWAVGAAVTQIAGDRSWATALGSAAGILLTMLILRIIAYRTEFDADVQACRMAAAIDGRVADVPNSYEQAAETLGWALMRVTLDHPSSRKPTWLHPGLSDRLDCMRRRATPSEKTNRAATIANPA